LAIRRELGAEGILPFEEHISMRILLLMLFTLLSSQARAAITAEAFIVMDLYGEVIMQKNALEERPIASITKLFVANDAIKLNRDELITVSSDDIRDGKMRSTPLKAGIATHGDSLLSWPWSHLTTRPLSHSPEILD
jgi:D-alanyl-D-alanine carboxypeptidase